MLGLTQQQMAELIGVTYQQAHKYETGINRISAGRLYQIARALGVEISYFFEDVEPGTAPRAAPGTDAAAAHAARARAQLRRDQEPKHQEALCHLARVLGDSEAGTQRAAGRSGCRADAEPVARRGVARAGGGGSVQARACRRRPRSRAPTRCPAEEERPDARARCAARRRSPRRVEQRRPGAARCGGSRSCRSGATWRRRCRGRPAASRDGRRARSGGDGQALAVADQEIGGAASAASASSTAGISRNDSRPGT